MVHPVSDDGCGEVEQGQVYTSIKTSVVTLTIVRKSQLLESFQFIMAFYYYLRFIALLSLATATPNPLSLFERTTCTTPDGSGTCLSTSSCTTGGFHVAGYCPGPTDIQCCIEKTCTTSSGSGICMNTQNTCSGKFVAGACPGPSDIQVFHF